MVAVLSPEFSFVRFPTNEIYRMEDSENWLHNNSPGRTLDFCLPVAKVNDLRFMFRFIVNDPAEQLQICAWQGSQSAFTLFVSPGIHSTVVPGIYPVIMNLGATWIRISASEWVMYVDVDLPSNFYDHIKIGDCFQLCLIYDNGFPNQYWLSNPFIRVEDDGHTTVVQYNCPDNQYGFYYCPYPSFYNRVRLPLYFGQHNYKENSKIYNKSNGEMVVRSATLSPVWDVTVDLMPKWAHDNLAVALIHLDFHTASIIWYDAVNQPRSSYKIKKEGAYETIYPDYLGHPWSAAKFKAVGEYYLGRGTEVAKYDNCNECTDISHWTGASLTTSSVTLNYNGCDTYPYFNLDALVIACSGPVTFFVAYQHPRVASYNISTAGALDFITNAAVGWTPGDTVILFVIYVFAPGLPATPITVYGTYTGITLC